MNEIKKVETKYSVRDGGHYTPGMIYHGVLYISGQLSIDPPLDNRSRFLSCLVYHESASFTGFPGY